MGGVSLRFEDNADWKRGLSTKDKKGTPSPDSLHNIILYLVNHENLSGVFAFDEFSHDVIVVKCPPWENGQNFRVHTVEDIDLTLCAAYLEQYDLKPAIEKVDRAITAAALHNRVHPARDWFNSLKWDGVPRLDNWLIYYAGCTTEDEKYVRAIGSKWLMAAVACVMQPGYKFDHMLILEGPEGRGKSTMLKALATINGVDYFTDQVTVSKLRDKDSSLMLLGKLIIEFPEVNGQMRKHEDMDDFKAWLTFTHDSVRRPFARKVSKFPRQFVPAGTLNPRLSWLDDPTGGRRFWPVTVGEKLDIEALNHDKEQLWAEAVTRFKTGEERLWLENDIWAIAESIRDERRVYDVWHDDIYKTVQHMDFVTTNEILADLGVEKKNRTKKEQNRVTLTLRNLGFKSGKKGMMHGWVRIKEKPKTQDLGF